MLAVENAMSCKKDDAIIKMNRLIVNTLGLSISFLSLRRASCYKSGNPQGRTGNSIALAVPCGQPLCVYVKKLTLVTEF